MTEQVQPQASVEDFLKQNVNVETATEEVEFKRFKSAFVIKELTNKKVDELRATATTKKKNPQTGQVEKHTDEMKVAEAMMVESVVTPNLNSKQLQESYGDLADPVGLLKDMLTVGELQDLSAKVMALSGINQNNLKDKTDEVKK